MSGTTAELRGMTRHLVGYFSDRNGSCARMDEASDVNISILVNSECECKSRRMRWAGHVARMGEERVCIGSWWGNRREGDHWRPRRRWVDNIRMDSRRWDVGLWTGLGWPRIETGGGSL